MTTPCRLCKPLRLDTKTLTAVESVISSHGGDVLELHSRGLAPVNSHIIPLGIHRLLAALPHMPAGSTPTQYLLKFSTLDALKPYFSEASAGYFAACIADIVGQLVHDAQRSLHPGAVLQAVASHLSQIQ